MSVSMAMPGQVALVELLQRFADEKGATPAQISQNGRSSPRSQGARKPERIEENLAAADVEVTAGELAKIEEELAKVRIHGNRADKDIAKLRQRIRT
jgi:aryl-alcohol dehydrogenase-like predicted oxidoreductase